MKATLDICEVLGQDKKHLFQKILPLEKIKDTSKLRFPMWGSEKFDGVFCCAMIDLHDEVHIFSRTGEEYLSLNHLKKDIKSFGLSYNYLLLFEAYIPNVGQNVISGACRDQKKQHPEVIAMIHSLVDWFHARNFMCDEATRNYSSLHFITHHYFNSLEEVKEFADHVWQHGGEGVVLRQNSTQDYHAGKRDATLIKIKKGLSVDLKVTGVYEGKGKYAGTLGGLLCTYKGKTIKVSGMTDAERATWWEDNNLIVGHIVQIDAMGESALGKLREPRFKGIRYDKEEADF